MKTCYIAGRIKGIKSYLRYFEKAETVVISMGYVPINPAAIGKAMLEANPLTPLEDIIRVVFCELIYSDAVYMLKGWEASGYAPIEHSLAREMGKTIYYEFPRDIIPASHDVATNVIRVIGDKYGVFLPSPSRKQEYSIAKQVLAYILYATGCPISYIGRYCGYNRATAYRNLEKAKHLYSMVEKSKEYLFTDLRLFAAMYATAKESLKEISIDLD